MVDMANWVALLMVAWLSGWSLTGSHTVQAAPSLAAGVTALASEGTRLFIGQESTLTEAAITSNGATPIRALDLGRGAIRAIQTIPGGLLILSEDGLTLFDSTRFTALDYAAGGGQRLTTSGNRVYVAALGAGLRIYEQNAGKLTKLAQFPTGGAAEDVSSAPDNRVWVAERDQGVRLYDLRNPLQPVVLLWSRDLQPARRVLYSNNRLILGYGGQIALINVANVSSPRLIKAVSLGSQSAVAGSLTLTGERLYVGRTDQTGADVIVYEMGALGSLTEVARYGDSGAGDHLSVSGAALWIGSERDGLRQLRIAGNALESVAHYPANPEAFVCDNQTPVNPIPANFSLLPARDSVTLRWAAECPASAYLVRISGQAEQRVTIPKITISNLPDVFDWQVVAVDPQARSEGEVWRLEVARDGLLIDPPGMRRDQVLYIPTVTAFFETPTGVLVGSVGLLVIGLVVVIIGAALIGSWSQRRQIPRV